MRRKRDLEDRMKIALAQMEVLPGQPGKNVDSMLRLIEEARAQDVDLIVFPEMCVGGYLLGDEWRNENFCKDLMEYNEILRKASNGIAIAYGNIFLDSEINKRVGDTKKHPNKDGTTRKYNAVYVFQDGKPVSRANDSSRILPEGVQPKTLLPNYRIFDDERYFFSLQDISKDFSIKLEKLAQPFMIRIDGSEVPVGFELCEDLWCEDYRMGGESVNTTKILINNGARYILNSSSSPWTFGKNSARDRRVRFLKQDSGESFVPFLYVNCTGAQNNGKNIVTFDGGSTAYNNDGLPVAFAKKVYQEELIIIDTDILNGESSARTEDSKIAQKYDAIITGIRHMKNIYGVSEDPKFIVGLSGGVDSALVAALLVKAVGPEKVMTVNMPSAYNSEKTKNSAKKVAESLGIRYAVQSIQEMAELNIKVLNDMDVDGTGKKLSSLNEENVQAKIRGTSILSNAASKYNATFTNNGNKLETALGYATLYGDVGGALAVIGDLTKAEVFEMARYVNNVVYRKEVIPESVFPDELFRFGKDKIIPSAELKNDQIDPMKFGYHDKLLEVMTDFRKKSGEDVMRWYLEGTMEKNLGVSTELIQRWGIDDPKTFLDDIEWFERSVRRNIFKRVQSPPIIITSKSAYGYDIRESMFPFITSMEHERLRLEILTMDKYRTAR
jgi:NAD+ synthase (glutamine-hydrolysing)